MDYSSNDDDEFLTPIDDEDALLEELKPAYQRDIEDFKSFTHRRRFAREVVEDAETMWGEAGILSLLHAIENQTGWSLEITAQRSDLDNILMGQYGIYDHDAWTKLKSSDEWIDISREIYELTSRRLDTAAAKIAGKHQEEKPKKSFRIWLTNFRF